MSVSRRGGTKSLKSIDQRSAVIENVITGTLNNIPIDQILSIDQASNISTGSGISSSTVINCITLNATNGSFQQIRINYQGTGTGTIANTNADGLVISSSTIAGMSLLSNDTQTCNIYFGDTTNQQIGQIVYDNLTDTFNINAGNTNIMNINASDVSINGDLTVTGTISAGSFTLVFPILANPNGTAAAPAYSFFGDSNTGMYRPSDNTVSFTTNGTKAINISSTLSQENNEESAYYYRDIYMDTDHFIMLSGDNNPSGFANYMWNLVYGLGTGYTEGPAVYGTNISGTRAAPTPTQANAPLNSFIGGGFENATYTDGAYYTIRAGSLWSATNHEAYHEFYSTSSAAGATPQLSLTIRNDRAIFNKILSGYSTSISGPLGIPQVQISGSDIAHSTISSICWNSSSGAGSLVLGRSKNNTIGSHTAVASGDVLSLIDFAGDDGSSFVDGGYIRAIVDGSVSAGVIPTRLEYTLQDSVGGYQTPLMVTTGQVRPTIFSSDGAPVYSFNSDSDTGFYRPSENTLSFVLGGNKNSSMEVNSGFYQLKVHGTGNVSFPQYTFASDSDTGMYNDTPSLLKFAVDGSKVLELNVSMQTLHFSATTATAPSISFSGDTVTGFFNPSAGEIGFGSLSNEILHTYSNGQFRFVNNGTATAPTISFSGDSNTGMYRPSDNTICFSTNGTLGLQIDPLQSYTFNDNIRGTATLVGGTIVVSTSAVKANSYILVTRNTIGGTVGDLSVPIASYVVNTSFTINSANVADTSSVNWLLFN